MKHKHWKLIKKYYKNFGKYDAWWIASDKLPDDKWVCDGVASWDEDLEYMVIPKKHSKVFHAWANEGKNVQVRRGTSSWESCHEGHLSNSEENLWHSDIEFRVEPETKKPFINWDVIDGQFKWAARHECGSVGFYVSKPQIKDEKWPRRGDVWILDAWALKSYKMIVKCWHVDFDAVYWKDSLIGRPQE
jgi:hypothetical protein